MSSLASLPTLLVLIFWPTSALEETFDVLPSFFFMNVITSALTSAKTKGASYLNVSSPSLMALTGVGPQQYTPEGNGGKDTVSTLLDKTTCFRWTVFLTFTLLLRRGVIGLPTIKVRFKVRSSHPVLYPAVIVPVDTMHTIKWIA